MNEYNCGKCGKSYSQKISWTRHFELTKVKQVQNGKVIYVANICYNSPVSERVCEDTVEKAKLKFADLQKSQTAAKRHFLTDNQLIKKAKTDDKPQSSTVLDVQPIEPPPSPPSDHAVVTMQPKPLKVLPLIPTQPRLKDQNKSDVIDEQPKSISLSLPKSSDDSTLTKILDKLCIQERIIAEVHGQITKNKDELPNNILMKSINIQPMSLSSSTIQDETVNNHLQRLSNAQSMEEILSNPLIELFEVFSVNEEKDDSSEEEKTNEETTMNFKMKCKACSDKYLGSKHGKPEFSVEDPYYETQTGKKMNRWFCNLKRSLKRHCELLTHHQNTVSYKIISEANKKTVGNVEKMCSSILYYIIKSNSAWVNYPKLLAILFNCGTQIGNLNHSVHACETMVNVIDDELKCKTKNWFKLQKSVTITADIGTILGLSMLVVLFESETNDKVFLAHIGLIESKEGIYCARKIFEILTSEKYLGLDIAEVKEKVTGMAGDGAFCKENEPFKSEMKKLFNENFKFRWDLLNLVNRAHVTTLENENNSHSSNVNKMMDYVQNHSKNFRSGLDYTKLRIDQVVGFRRPKIKSETRLVVYDFDQLFRFLQNSKFFDHPGDTLSLARVMILVSCVIKIILKCVQATDVSSSFIETIFYEAKGKEVMLQVIQWGKKLLLGENTSKVVPAIKSKDTPLSYTEYLVNEVSKFVHENADDIYDHDSLEIIKKQAKTRKQHTFGIDSVIDISTKYTNTLWDEIKNRLEYFDKDGPTRWSEAPSEGIFSILDAIVDYKPSLTFKHMISLCRVVKEGPAVCSKEANVLVKDCMENWPARKNSKKFITDNWLIGTTSKTVKNELSK